MTAQDPNLRKLQDQNKLLASELEAIKSSRSYKLVKTAGILKNQVKSDPVGTAKKVAKALLRKPKQILRLARGQESNSALQDAIQNRLANYHSWIALNEPKEEELAVQREASQKLTKKPLISIITPVFNPPADVLESLIESVIDQTYPYFELCLGNFGDSQDVKDLLARYAKQDSRVKVYEFTENKGIAYNSNLILKKATGDYIALLDHDDLLSPDALYENAVVINKENSDFVYSDKDMMDEQGNRFEPLFKPDWSPEVMLSANYLTHLNVMRASIVREVGGWDSDTDGAQDWDLFLKVVQASKRVSHVPKVLYHWRVIATSTAHSIDTKPYALAGQRRAVQKYLDKQGIKATPYHKKTELLLKWDDSAIDQKPLIMVRGSTVAAVMRMVATLHRYVPKQATFVVLYDNNMPADDEAMFIKQGVKKVYRYPKGHLGRKLNEVLAAHTAHDTVLFVDDALKLPNKWNYSDLTGWLSIKGVAMAGGKIIGRDNVIADCGAVITADGPVPIFRNYPPYYPGYLGNVEWVRNLRVVSRQLFAAKAALLRQQAFSESLSDDATVMAAMLNLSKKHRLVLCPKVEAYTTKEVSEPREELADMCRTLLDKTLKSHVDTFSNPNVLPSDPMRLNLQQPTDTDEATGQPIDAYRHDALILSCLYDLTEKDIAYNRALGDNPPPLTSPKTVGWFLPGFDAIYAGLNNIFSYAEFLAAEHKLATTFFIMRGDQGVEAERQMVTAQYPGLKKAKFVSITSEAPKNVPRLDIGICTQWASAYPLARLRNVTRKCYFIQDHESNFYPKGSVSALVDLSYKLNFFAIANTKGLLDMYKKQYGGRGIVVQSLVDLTKYTPPKDKRAEPKKPYRVFFYARPNMPRNAFELGLAGLTKLKEQLGKDVQIFTAGAAWDPEALGAGHIVTNLNKIPYDDVPAFYRSLDAGMMFMFSGHPGVTASELMASGCPVVVNDYDDVTWRDLYQDEKTCVITEPTASEIARNLRRCLEDTELRKTLITNGLKKTKSFYSGYEAARKKSFEAIKKGR